MARLPDLAGLAIFAKVAECRSFADAAAELRLSKATVSKAVSRIKSRLGARLIIRTARRFPGADGCRTPARGAGCAYPRRGRGSRGCRGGASFTVPRGPNPAGGPDVIRAAACGAAAAGIPRRLSGGNDRSAAQRCHSPISSATAFDAAIRIAVLPGDCARCAATLRVPRYLVGSPDYLNKYGRPKHPLHLVQHRCLAYSYSVTTEAWHFTKGAKSASVQPSGPLRVNNGDAMMPALIAGTGLGILPEFILRGPQAESAGEIIAGLVASARRRLLGHAAGGAATRNA